MSPEVLISSPIRGENGYYAKVCVQEGERMADCIVPGGRIERNKGFTQDELKQVTAYLKDHEEEIIEQSKKIDPLKNWLGL